MAERLGFEPRKELPLCRFSRPVLSTAQPSLRANKQATFEFTTQSILVIDPGRH